MVNLTKSFYIGVIKKLAKQLNGDKTSFDTVDKIVRDINFISSMYRFPKPTVPQMENILRVCDKLGVRIIDLDGIAVRNIAEYESIIDLHSFVPRRPEYDM